MRALFARRSASTRFSPRPRRRVWAPRRLQRFATLIGEKCGRVSVKVVRFYKYAVSPWLPAACRFTPTCSEYAAEAIERYGVVRGGLKAMHRLLRCQPLHRGGFDPLI